MSEIMNASANVEPQKTVNTQQVIDKISYDKRVDRMDLPEVSALEEVISQEKQGILSHTKEKLLAHIEQSLIDGFTVETQEDYEVLKKLLSLLWKKQSLPEYKMAQHLVDTTGKNPFSVTLDTKSNILKLYWKLPHEIAKNKQVGSFSFMGYISLVDGSFTQKNVINQYQFDLLDNNNQFDFPKK